jgi:D-alanyl-D-alanine carboxypeptidase
LLSYNVDCPFNPASVVKLATSDVALTKLGASYRFTTRLLTNGGLDADGTLDGDLVVSRRRRSVAHDGGRCSRSPMSSGCAAFAT